jgi:hypothetical protein
MLLSATLGVSTQPPLLRNVLSIVKMGAGKTVVEASVMAPRN